MDTKKTILDTKKTILDTKKTILDINDWNNYLYKKKISFINEIDIFNSLDNSHDSARFNNILKTVIKQNIFNLSYITFMKLKFLETTFVPSAVLLNAIEIYTDSQMYDALNICETSELYKFIKTLKFILNLIIEFIIKVEIILNIQCLLITNFIDKINSNMSGNMSGNMSSNINYSNIKPTIFKLFDKNNTNICKNIKPSTLILLFFKLLNKLNMSSYNNNEIHNILNDKNYNKNYYNKKYITKKANIYLDAFIVEITHFFNEKHNKSSIYIICSKYILNNLELIFNNFENLFSYLDTHILQTQSDTTKLEYLKTFITNLSSIEFNNIKKLFFIN